jgi:hypothetical protein
MFLSPSLTLTSKVAPQCWQTNIHVPVSTPHYGPFVKRNLSDIRHGFCSAPPLKGYGEDPRRVEALLKDDRRSGDAIPGSNERTWEKPRTRDLGEGTVARLGGGAVAAISRRFMKAAVILAMIVIGYFCIVRIPEPWNFVIFTVTAFAGAFVLVFYKD